LALAALVAHAPALRNGFVLDDNVLLADNPHVRSLAGLRELVSHELFVASAEPRFVPYYRPLSGALNWLSYQLFGASAPLQHALNLLLHAAVTVLLFRVTCAWRVGRAVALAAALLFAVHPATAEVVAYVGGRQDMLGWLLGLIALLLTPRLKCIWCALGLGFAASLLGALCHELFIGLFLPLALLMGASRAESAKAKALAIAGGGVLAVAALLGLRRWLGLLPFEANVNGPLPAVRASVGVALRLLKDAVAPTDLAVDVSVPLPSAALSLPLLLGSVVGLGSWARSLSRRRPDLLGPLLAGFAIAGLSAALHAGVVLKYGIISDRYAYALLIGLSVSLSVSVETWLSPLEASTPLLAALKRWGAFGLALAMLPLTWSRDASWFDQKSLQLAMIADRPDDPESWLAEAMLSFATGDLERAYPRCRAYADARPDSDKANLCVGSWLLLHGRSAEAVRYLRPYALARPGLASARRTFLYALLTSGQHEELGRTLRDWSQAFPGSPELVEAQAALDRAHQVR
jgi:hypothetical protein